jgi:drug/metabolite transporter (DMT)-like permease
MTAMTSDTARQAPAATVSGLALAVVSATSFGLSGALASGLLASGWSPGAVVLVRIALAAAVLAPFGIVSLRGRWDLVRRSAGTITVYGLLAVAGAQLAYFSAIATMPVGPAILLEYTAPLAVVGWMWARHRLRPTRLTVVGAGVAAAGLVLVLDLLHGTTLSTAGVLWALGAMVGAATYFVLSADRSTGLPPLTLAAGGLLVGGAVLGASGAVGLLPLRWSAAPATYAGHAFHPALPLLALGLVTAALAYATGIAASRRLGSRLASFVALLEVVAGTVFAWLLLGQAAGPGQVLGGALVVVGVVVVRLGERRAP